MKIEILSHRELVQRAFQDTPQNLIFISSPTYPFIVERSQEAVARVASKLVLLFDDMSKEEPNVNAPERRHTLDAIRFAESVDDLVVSCRMGVSRSAAIAFGVAAKRSGIELMHSEYSNPNAILQTT